MIDAGALRTERLRLEPFAPRHAPALLAYFDRNRAHIEPWEPRRAPAFYTLDYQEAEIARARDAAQREEYVRFAAFEADGDEIVGNVNLWKIMRGAFQAATIGYSVDARREGRGFATEASDAVVRYAFDVLRLHRVQSTYQPTNERSGRVLRKLGFAVEGYARDYLRIDGRWADAILVARTNSEWTPRE